MSEDCEHFDYKISGCMINGNKDCNLKKKEKCNVYDIWKNWINRNNIKIKRKKK